MARSDSKGAKIASSSRAWDALTPALSEWVLQAVDSMGFDRMTPVQASTIPLFTGNKDPVVEAVTGSGKTLAFLIPIVERLLKLEEPTLKHHVGAIIVSPTRELATQIHKDLAQLLSFHGPSTASLRVQNSDDGPSEDTEVPPSYSTSTLKIVPQLLLGGSNSTVQSDLAHFLKLSPNILIATPGRLLELLSSPHVHAPQSSFQVLVLDEADRLLNLGFKDTLRRILNHLPKQRRTGLFSASMSDAVEELVRVGIQNPYRVNVKVKSLVNSQDIRLPASLSVHYITTKPSQKLPILLKLVANLDPHPLRTIVYAPTCAMVDYLKSILPALVTLFHTRTSLQIVSLHGKHKQVHREKNLVQFTNSASPTLLLTTDLAARGLDIPAVDLTVQLDPPADESDFLHRAGRAGRAGRKGTAVIFLMPGSEVEGYPAFLERRSTPATCLEAPDVTVSEKEANEATHMIRETVLQDRALHDKAQQAFPSYIQAYRKRSTAKSFFRMAELPWEDLAKGWGLLRIPRMPELRKWCHKVIDLGIDVDWDNYGYKDKTREKNRKAKASEGEHVADDSHATNIGAKRKREKEAWSQKRDERETREARRDKRGRKRVKEKESTMTADEKGQQDSLQQLIEQVRKQYGNDTKAAGVEAEFEGFD